MPFSCLCVHSTHRIRDRFLTCRCATLIALLNNLLFFACNKKQNELKLFYTQSTFSIALCCGLLFVSFLLERRASTQIEQVRSVFFFRFVWSKNEKPFERWNWTKYAKKTWFSCIVCRVWNVKKCYFSEFDMVKTVNHFTIMKKNFESEIKRTTHL